LLILCAITGLVAGLGAAGFYAMLDLAKHFLLGGLAGCHPGAPGGEPPLLPAIHTPFRPWVLLLLPCAGGLVSGALVRWLAPEAEGHGTDAAIRAYHTGGGAVRGRVPFVKALASALTIGTGGSGGREGPIAQIGSGFGSALGKWLRLNTTQRRILMAAGMAAGVGAIFRAPMAGALFSAEILYRELDFEYEVIAPSVISSITAYSVFASIFGWNPLFVTPPFEFTHPPQIAAYLVLAVIVAIGALVYIRCFYGVRRLFQRLPLPFPAKTGLGGLLTGAIGLIAPDALASSYGILQRALATGSNLAEAFGGISAGALLLVAGAKTLATAFSIGSGGSGGVFGPAVVIGGALGGATGLFLQPLFPALHIQPGAFVIVGMAGFFAAAAKTPISTIIMVSELTGNYNLLAPAMLVCVVAYMLARSDTLYREQFRNRFEAPGHLGEMAEAVLRGTRISEILSLSAPQQIYTLSPGDSLSAVLRQFASGVQTCFPVINDQGQLQGVVHGRDIRLLVQSQGGLLRAVIAQDMASPPITATPDEDLLTAIRRMNSRGVEDIIVVNADQPLRPLAILRHEDVIRAYHSLMANGAPAEPPAPPA